MTNPPDSREKWVLYARDSERPPETVMPVDEAPPTKEWADQLSSRLETLKKEFLTGSAKNSRLPNLTRLLYSAGACAI
jgi:hypothetical protein